MELVEEIARSLYRYDVEAEKLNSLQDIGAVQLKQYRDQGFLAVGNMLSSHEVKNALDSISDIIHQRITGAKLQFEFDFDLAYARPRAMNARFEEAFATPEERELALRKIHDYVKVVPRLGAIAYKQEILEIVEKILGEKAILVQDMALLKPPFGGSEKPWHQDMAYGPLAYDKPIVAIWIALDDADVDNGCMHVIPRSHADGGTPHYAIRDWQLCDSSVPVSRDVTVPLKSGGGMFFHGMLYHGTPANLSPKRRRALQFHYAPISAVKVTPQEYKRMYTNEMSGAEC